jgi:FdhD protein
MERTFAPVTSSARVSSPELLALSAKMRADQALFDRTGGLHAAALFEGGALACLREDIGRHNAVDKVAGWALRARKLPLSDAVLLVSGRAGYEVVQKAVACGIPIVAAVGAPSSLAARLAEQAGVTLVGFLREGSFNVYSHSERVTM